MRQYLFLLILALIFSSKLVAEDQYFASPALDYELITVPAGQYDLFIPIPATAKLEYVKKSVKIERAFAIGKYEVSNQQWNQCFQAGACAHPADIQENETLNNPVVRVTWHDAYQFSKWLSHLTKSNYRLPTEEEWYYAVYEGKTHKETEMEYDYSNLAKINLIKKRTKPRGYYPSNTWGLSDYLGNVWEWSLTCWYASEENILKPVSASQLNSPTACYTRIALGENRSHIPDFISDTYSGGCATLRPAANLGFRLVMELTEKGL